MHKRKGGWVKRKSVFLTLKKIKIETGWDGGSSTPESAISWFTHIKLLSYGEDEIMRHVPGNGMMNIWTYFLEQITFHRHHTCQTSLHKASLMDYSIGDRLFGTEKFDRTCSTQVLKQHINSRPASCMVHMYLHRISFLGIF